MMTVLVEEKKHEISATNQMWAAIRTIIIADTMMGLDNVSCFFSSTNNL
jgi:predicted tellurium resistance membrane protein TerC